PLSYAQQRQWVLWQIEPESTAYHMSSALRLTGELNIEALRDSFDYLFARHEVLRTHFAQGDEGQLHQVIKDKVSITLNAEALSFTHEQSQDAALQQVLQQLGDEVFDLAEGPLLRVKLISLSAQAHVLALVQHHVVSDAWSMQLMVSELVQAYSAFSQHQTPELPSLPIQYADYAVWQRERLEGEEGERQLTYWREKLGTEHPVLELPTDHARPMQASYAGASQSVALDSELINNLTQLANQESTTLFTLLLASFQTLLHRYSGQEEIRVGTPIANRNRLETENLIGFFVNTQVLRADFADDLTFNEFLQQVKQTTLDAQDNQDLPFEQLVEKLQVERSLSHTPLFQAMFNYLSEKGSNKESQLANIDGLAVEGVRWDGHTAQFDLTLDINEYEGGISASFNYATDLFEPSTIERLAKHWQQLLQGIVAKPNERIAELPLLDQAEKKHIIEDWNDTAVSYDTEVCIHQLFEQQVELNPHKTALILDDEKISYQTLNEKANRLAHKLLELGVGPDVPVGISVERSFDMIISLLAVLKAGGAYVPLDPKYPTERLTHMIEDSGLKLLLTQSNVIDELSVSADVNVLLLDDDIAIGYSEHNIPNLVHPYNLAYIIFTSGSTGRPKGVCIDHSSLVRHAVRSVEMLDLTSNDTVLQFATFNFDAFVEQLYPALCCGASVVLRGQELWGSEEFYQQVLKHNISVADLSTAYWYQLVSDFSLLEERSYGSLRQISIGGEALSQEGLRACKASMKEVALLNTYGPTETTVSSTIFDCSCYVNSEKEIPSDIPIGRPLSGSTTYILDVNLNTTPIGVIGELCIGGELLARGYRGQAMMTAERFIADPFNESGGRLYRTGDLARYRIDGTIEYVGRIDHQVKIRGFRIELGEIESQLQGNDAIRDAVVLAQEGNAGQQLVAYVIPNDSGLIEAGNEAQNSFRADIKNQLQQALPEYMVPAHMLLLEQFPLTPNGKLDRKALPKADASQLQQTYVAPTTELEKRLAQIWQDVLGVEQVGLNDNFFALGGHSLLLTQVVSRVRQALSAEIPMRVMFEASDLRDFAVRVAQSEGVVSEVILPVSREQELPLSYAQQRQWVLWQIEPESTAYHMSSALRLTGELNIEALRDSFDYLFARHEVLRTHFAQGDEGQLHQVIKDKVSITLNAEALSFTHEQSQDAALQQVLQQLGDEVFDLAEGPLLRVKLISLSAQAHVLALVQHHVVSDAWSMQLMVSELVQAYSAFSQHQTPELPSLPIQYADYAVWQRERLEGEEGERQLTYWREKLGTEHPVLELPTDHARPMQASYAGASQSVALDSELINNLTQLANQESTTLFTLLLASFQTLLHRYSGQEEIRVGTPIANRNRLETENLIGFFVNTQVLRADFADDLTFNEFLQQVKQTTLDAQDNQDLPFEQLVEKLQVERSLSHTPLFQAMFNYLSEKGSNKESQLANIDGLAVEGVRWDGHTAQFDLTLDINEYEGGISASFNYATDLFEPSTIERLAKHWQQLLQGIVAKPNERIAELPLLDQAEKKHIIEDWNDTAVSYDTEVCIHQLFEQQVELNPHKTALILDDEKISYQTLNEKANRLAHKLLELGVGPDVPVGISVERSFDMIISLLAVLKAGGAYVPLDPKYPTERLTHMIEDSGLKLLLTQSNVIDELSVSADVNVLLLDDDIAIGYSEHNIPNLVHPYNLAYIIFTSGSTGRPKGVCIDHSSLVRHAVRSVEMLDLTSNDTVLQFATFNFDAFVEQLYPALCCGASVVLRGQELWGSEEFYQQVLKHNISVADLSTAYWYQLVSDFSLLEERSYGSLRQISIGGEALSQEGLRACKASMKEVALLNTYGPTETTVSSTIFDCSCYVNSEKEIPSDIPIGRPLSGSTTYILDVNLNTTPIGVIGELCIGGELLARGYRGQAMM
ncbi:MAG: amino acid adenylation domain-containing protein, partial [Gammaproteobacteria bacterium]|nr:amino acid adenylation domain-containing protein [Gammaproteobacteria bacterium]